MRYIITIDQRTSSSKVLLFDEGLNLLDRKSADFEIIRPRPDWVEADAEAIFTSTMDAVSRLELPAFEGNEFSVSICNQRESVVLWDRNTGKPVYHAILWRCRRGTEICNELADQGQEPRIREITGLVADPYFSASKVKWVLDNIPSVRERAERGDVLMGTIDSWLIWKLTGGKVHATDYTNASRTMLFNLQSLEWDQDMMRLFNIPAAMLPEPRPSDSSFGCTDLSGLLPEPVTIAGVIGNSHGALVGQMCFDKGMGKTTYGTGSSVMFNVGDEPVKAPNGMVCSVGYSMFDNTYYVLEGHSHSSGAVLDWLRDNLQIIGNADETQLMANSVPDNGGVYFVPAFSGLGSPWWIPQAKAMITGLTIESTRAHVVRAALESIAYQVSDVVELTSRELAAPPRELCVDGQWASNSFLMQFQADILGIPVCRMDLPEASGLGSAILNCCNAGIFTSIDQIRQKHEPTQSCEPQMKPEERIRLKQGWLQSVHTVMLSTPKQSQ